MTTARLAGRSAIVTGGAKGIGRHYSQALAAEGAEVMIADLADGTALAVRRVEVAVLPDVALVPEFEAAAAKILSESKM